VFYSGLLGEENAYLWRTSLYLAASASAEFFADIALSPMEAIKVCLLSDLFKLMSLMECDTGLCGNIIQLTVLLLDTISLAWVGEGGVSLTKTEQWLGVSALCVIHCFCTTVECHV